MRRVFASAFIAAITLAGCGGDDASPGKADTPAVGYLTAGGAQGVRFRTATQSGFTDAAGGFRYLPGENVTFSVGAIELGSVQGANRVSLFTLAGASQPTTEPELRRELDRALRVPTPFLRATNLARFLMAFDADGIPENGLDVFAAGAALESASLDFGQGLHVFASRLESLPQPKTENIPYWRPIAHLYRVENVAVAARVPLHVQHREESLVFPGIDSTYTYRNDGLRETLSQDITLDGVPDAITWVTYDAMGRPATSRQQVGDFFGGINFITESTYEYDSRGRFLRQDSQTDASGDGTIDSTLWSEVEGAPAEGFVRHTFRTDTDGDGNADVIEIHESTLDRTLRVQFSSSRVDGNADGTIDSRYDQVASFDARERISLLTNESDDDGDGIVDYRRATVFTYTESPRTARSEESIDFDGDGVIERITITTHGLDDMGNDLTRVIEQDDNADGIAEQRYAQASTFDTERRRLTTVEDQDYTGDGIVDSRLNETLSYAPAGGLLTHRSDFDWMADGLIEQRKEQRYDYGAGGELLGWGQYDLDASPTDPSSWITVENIGFADGVRALAQTYFELGGVASF